MSDDRAKNVTNAMRLLAKDAEIARLRAELAEAEARGYRRAVEDARKAVLALDTGKSAGRDLSYNLAVRRGADAIRALGERGRLCRQPDDIKTR